MARAADAAFVFSSNNRHTASSGRESAVKWLILLLVALFVFLQYRLWVGEGSLVDVQRLREAIAVQKQENERLRERNAALQAEVEDLKKGLAAVEERARNELGMVKKGETFYQIVEPEK